MNVTSELNPVGVPGTGDATVVHLIENHDEAYHLWRGASVTGRTLVHVDAHHDMAWLDHPGQINIGNYVCQAMKDGTVNEVVWVVPDASWRTRSSRDILHRHLSTLARSYPGPTGPVLSSTRRLSTRLIDVPFTICALDSLPELRASVLLDIDVDFVMLPMVEFLRDERPEARPWLWPADVVGALRRKDVKSEFVTIAYSVAGGYVPMQWKYLGEELALEWRHDSAPAAEAREGFRLLRRAALANAGSRHAEAAADLTQAADFLPGSAAPHFNLALLHLDTGDLAQAREAFLNAVKADASCRGPHASRGFVCLSEGRNDEAQSEFQQILTLDPRNPFALLGLGRIAVLRRRWDDAEHFLKAAIAVDPRLIDAHRYLGDTLVKLHRDEEAAAAYSRSLKLALDGEISIEEAVHTPQGGSAPRDGRHDRFHAALADIDARAGRLSQAVAGYRMALAAREDRVGMRLRLAWLYLRQCSFASAARECQIALVGGLGRWRTKKKPRSAVTRIEAGEK